MGDHAIGSRISLISKADIAYEGFLHFINPEENTVGLKDVRMLGTQGRRNGQNEVDPSSTVYEFIIFRGGDIKDLVVHEDAPAAAAAPAVDPAIVSSQTRTNTYADRARGPAGQDRREDRRDNRGGMYDNRRDDFGTRGRDFSRRDDRNFERRDDRNFDRRDDRNFDRRDDRVDNNRNRDYGHRENYGGRDHTYGNRGGYRGGYRNDDRRTQNHGHGHGGHGHGHGGGFGGHNDNDDFHTGRDFKPATGANKEKLQEFDFNKARDDFEKHKAEFERAREEAQQDGVKAYDKGSGFFDTLTSNKAARGFNRDTQMRADTETFGQEMVGSMRGFRRGRGGRGRFSRH